MIKKTDDKKVIGFKNLNINYLDKRSDIMKNMQFKVEDDFGDLLGEKGISHEPLINFKNFLAKIIYQASNISIICIIDF